MKQCMLILLLALAVSTEAQNVGIGTTSPNYPLDINGRMRLRNDGNTSGIWFNKADNTEAAFTGMFNDTIIGFYGNNTWRIGADIKNARLGINNMTPAAPLGFSNGIGEKIDFYYAGATNRYGIGLQSNLLQLYSFADIAFGTGSSTAFNEKMRVRGNGNVGIGTGNPGATLQVVRGAGLNGTAQFDGTVNASHFNYGSTEETYIRGGKAASQVIINDNASGNVRLAEGGGNVGIGIAAPAAKLDIAGNVKIDDGTQGDGKVLTSDANGLASWKSAAYGNTERFQFQIYMYDQQPGMLFTNYNLGTASATYTSPNPFFSVRILSGGLYHFDANCYVSLTGNYSETGDGKTVDFLAYNVNTSTNFSKIFCPYFYYASENTSRASGMMSFDLYVPGNTSLRFSVNQFLVAGYEKRITVTGNKIAD